MRMFTFSISALAALMFVGIDTSVSQAGHAYSGFGIHIGGRNVQLDIGSRQAYYPSAVKKANYHRAYSKSRWYGYPSRPHAVWYDTSYWGYHPAEYVRHGNHYHYIPGHYDRHDDCREDHPRGHYGRRH